MDGVMKVRDLIARLQECAPEATVKIMLDAAVLYDDEGPGEVEYGFEPVVECLFSQSEAKRSDRVYFQLSNEDTVRILETRRDLDARNVTAVELHTTSNPAIALDAPAAVAIAISRDVYNDLLAVVESCNQAHQSNGATTHGKLDIPSLLAMLAEDAAMTNTRPGSWEGANLQQVLDSHGYYSG